MIGGRDVKEIDITHMVVNISGRDANWLKGIKVARLITLKVRRRTMTWGELKALVDRELQQAGKGDDIEIDYIDINMPVLRPSTDSPYMGEVEVFVGDDLAVST